jgi:hypothetical protein
MGLEGMLKNGGSGIELWRANKDKRSCLISFGLSRQVREKESRDRDRQERRLAEGFQACCSTAFEHFLPSTSRDQCLLLVDPASLGELLHFFQACINYNRRTCSRAEDDFEAGA